MGLETWSVTLTGKYIPEDTEEQVGNGRYKVQVDGRQFRGVEVHNVYSQLTLLW